MEFQIGLFCSPQFLIWIFVGSFSLDGVAPDSSEERRPFSPFSPFGFPLAPVPLIGRAPPLAAFRVVPAVLPAAPPLVSPFGLVAITAPLIGHPVPTPDGVVFPPAYGGSSGSGSFDSGSGSGSESGEDIPLASGVLAQPLQIVPIGVIHKPSYSETTPAIELVKPYDYNPKQAKLILQPVVHKAKPKKYTGHERKLHSKPSFKAEESAVVAVEEMGNLAEQPAHARECAIPKPIESFEQPKGSEVPEASKEKVVLPGPPSKKNPKQKPIEALPDVTSSITQIKVEVKNVPKPPVSQRRSGDVRDENRSLEDNRPTVKKVYPDGKYDRTEAYPQRLIVQEAHRPYIRAYELEEPGESEGYKGAVNYPGFTSSRDLRPRPLF